MTSLLDADVTDRSRGGCVLVGSSGGRLLTPHVPVDAARRLQQLLVGAALYYLSFLQTKTNYSTSTVIFSEPK